MIDPNKYGLIEMGFTAAVVLGFAIWQLWTVRDAGKPKRDDSPSDAGHPEGQHGLDDR